MINNNILDNRFIYDSKAEDHLNEEFEDDSSSEQDYFNLSLKPLLPVGRLVAKKNKKKIDNNKKHFLFIVIREEAKPEGLFKIINPYSYYSNLNKKRGRKKISNKGKYEHTALKNDNKMIKIQAGYISFLIKLINEIIDKKLLLKINFLDIDYNYKSNIKREFRIGLNKKKIKDIILEAPISPKFSTKDINYNTYKLFSQKKLYNRILNLGNNIVLDILEKNFLFFFENLYFKNITKFNLSSFGFEPFEIQLPFDTKTFKDLKLINKIGDSVLYKKEMEACAKKYFLFNHKKSNN